MSSNNRHIFTYIAFVLCPILAFPDLIQAALHRRKWAYYLLSIFLGLCGMFLLPPHGDQYRHALDFYELQGLSLDYYLVRAAMDGHIDFLLSIIEYLISISNLPFFLIRGILTFIASFLFLKLYDYLTNNKNIAERKKILIVIFIVFPLGAICSGMRFGFACCLLCYVMVKWYVVNCKKTTKDLIIIAISILFHTSMLMFVVVWLISVVMPNYIPKHILYLSFIIALIFSPIFYQITDHLPLGNELQNTVSRYTEGENSTSEYATNGANIFGMLKFYLGSYCIQIPMLIIILNKLSYNHQTKLLYSLVILWFLTFNMFSINGRVMSCIVILGCFYLLKNYNFNKLFVTYLICVFMLTSLLNWRVTLHSKWEDLFLPIPITITDDYSYNWIIDHNDINGAPC